MAGFYLFVGVLLIGMCATLYFFPGLKTLNFVNYESVQDPRALNRYAAVMFLIPAFVSFLCAYLAHTNPRLFVPVLFLGIISNLGVVIWIAARTSRKGD